MTDAAAALVADHVLRFDYTRSTGPVVGAFLTGLREARLLGVRTRDGRVVVPPQEYDPVTSAELGVADLVEVATSGVVTTWTWNPQPRAGQPLADRPFAWVLVRLDGADTAIAHALDVASPDQVTTGMRVAVRWAPERHGRITDIACFEPARGAEASASSGAAGTDAADDGDPDPAPATGGDPDDGEAGRSEVVTMVTTPAMVALTHHPGPVEGVFLRGTQQRRLLGRRCSRCAKVYLPPRGVCSMCGAAFTEEVVEVGQTGTVATFAVVNVPFAGQEVEIPYAAVEVLWDGAHITSQFLFRGAPLSEVRMGMRVRAVWAEGDLEPTLSNITHVEPVDEPDTPFEAFSEYV